MIFGTFDKNHYTSNFNNVIVFYKYYLIVYTLIYIIAIASICEKFSFPYVNILPNLDLKKILFCKKKIPLNFFNIQQL